MDAETIEDIGLASFTETGGNFPHLRGKLVIRSDNRVETQGRVCSSGWNAIAGKFIVIYNLSIFNERFERYGLNDLGQQKEYVKTCFVHEFYHSETNTEESRNPTFRDEFCHECDIKLAEAHPNLKKYVRYDWPGFDEEKDRVLQTLQLLRRGQD